MAGAVPDIPGVKAPPEGAREIQYGIMELLKRNTQSFPGAQPVSFAKRHLNEELMNEDYFVCEKSDGLRCLMYLSSLNGEERVYFITRKNEVYWIPDLHIPLQADDFSSFHDRGSLIDGELVRTQDGKLKYLMFDMLAFNGEVLVQRHLDKRLGYLETTVFRPFSKLTHDFPQDTAVFPFKIYMKPMELSYGIGKVLQEKHSHLSDGLIFTSREAPYIYGTDPKIIKWKPAEENSVDFLLELKFQTFHDEETNESWPDYDSMPKCILNAWCGGKREKPYGEMYLEESEWEKLKSLKEPLNFRVVECSMDTKGRWRYLRFRDDKEHGNHIDTTESVIESIRDHITEDDLLSNVEKIRASWHQRASDRKKRPAPGQKSDSKRHHGA